MTDTSRLPEPAPYSVRWVFQDYLLDNPKAPPALQDIVRAIMDETLSGDGVSEICARHGIDPALLHEFFLDLVLYYAGFALVDHELSREEVATVGRLKRLLGIQEGAFWGVRRDAVARLVSLGIERILADRQVSKAEELHQVELQALFDLGYDQFAELTAEAVAALFRDAEEEGRAGELLEAVRDLNPLVAVRRLVGGSDDLTPLVTGRVISKDVRYRVWARDGGRCVQCGSTKDLQFDHIIPYSFGGSNDYANIQLLCGECNRLKGASLEF